MDDLKKLRREITVLLEQIDGEGLLFLKKQASTIIYNTTVQEMNQKNQESLLQNQEEKNSHRTARKKEREISHEGEIFVDMSGKAKGFCNIVCGKVRVFFPLEELDSLIYIAKKASSQGDGGLLLYRWLKRERGDFLVDNGIKSYPSRLLDLLGEYLSKF